jgi:hypothetical protein
MFNSTSSLVANTTPQHKPHVLARPTTNNTNDPLNVMTGAVPIFGRAVFELGSTIIVASHHYLGTGHMNMIASTTSGAARTEGAPHA